MLILVQFISRHLIKKVSEHHGDEVLENLIKELDEHIRTRFYELERHPLYAECTILDPRFKRRGFRTDEGFLRASETLKSNIMLTKQTKKIIVLITLFNITKEISKTNYCKKS